jgi:hypothetical protein
MLVKVSKGAPSLRGAMGHLYLQQPGLRGLQPSPVLSLGKSRALRGGAVGTGSLHVEW